MKKKFLKDMDAAERLAHELQKFTIEQSNGCMESTRCRNTPGYPHIRHQDEIMNITALLVAVDLGCEVDRIPRDSTRPSCRLSWLHSCKNPLCINPAHGRSGTNRENQLDSDGSLSIGPGTHQRKPIKAVNLETGQILSFESSQDAGRRGFDPSHVSAAARGLYARHNSHGGISIYRGHKWSYK